MWRGGGFILRLKFECEYVNVKSKKGFKGYWHSHYTVKDIRDLEGKEIYIDSYTFENIKGFKGKGFKLGDKITFKATLVEEKGKYMLKYIRDIIKV